MNLDRQTSGCQKIQFFVAPSQQVMTLRETEREASFEEHHDFENFMNLLEKELSGRNDGENLVSLQRGMFESSPLCVSGSTIRSAAWTGVGCRLTSPWRCWT